MADESKSDVAEPKPESGWSDPASTEPEAALEAVPQESLQKDLSRPSAEDIYKQVAKNAQEELKRSSVSLAISGLTGGIFMGLSALGVGVILAHLGGGPGAFVVSRMFYPLGFIVVILGRSQLFTENTLYPVALVLTEPQQIWNTMRLWATVLPANVVGAFLFAMLAGLTHAMPADVDHLLERRRRRLDHRDRRMAGQRIALHHRLRHGYLDADVRRRPGKLRPLHRHQRRDPDRRADPPTALGCLSALVRTRRRWQHLRRRHHGHPAGVWAGHPQSARRGRGARRGQVARVNLLYSSALMLSVRSYIRPTR
jgi:uncharacterized protein (DUF2062 family)